MMIKFLFRRNEKNLIFRNKKGKKLIKRIRHDTYQYTVVDIVKWLNGIVIKVFAKNTCRKKSNGSGLISK